MMTIGHLLQDFGKFQGNGSDPIVSDATLEEHQLEAFEQGYRAGWDDSASAHAEDNTKASADLARALQQISFTHHDAQRNVLRSLRPLFEQISAKLLPEIAQNALPSLIAEQLLALVTEHKGETLTLAVSEQDRPAIEAAVREHGSYALKFETNRSLAAGQVEISTSHDQQSFNLEHVVEEIRQALNAFTHIAERNSKHG